MSAARLTATLSAAALDLATESGGAPGRVGRPPSLRLTIILADPHRASLTDHGRWLPMVSRLLMLGHSISLPVAPRICSSRQFMAAMIGTERCDDHNIG